MSERKKIVKNEEKQVFFLDFIYNKVILLDVETSIKYDTHRKVELYT